MEKTGKATYLASGSTDLRKSINALSAMVQGSMSMNPFDEAVFVFCNRKRDLLKILEWDTDGFWLHQKRLERGHFKWPTESDEPTMELTSEEFDQFLNIPHLTQKLRRNEVRERNIV